MSGSPLFSRTDRNLIEKAIRELRRIANGLDALADAINDDPVDDPAYIVDVKFTPNGVSLNVYHSDGSVYDESWYTWSEVDHRKPIDDSDFTAELPHPPCTHGPAQSQDTDE
jgi:hypothetical protein